MRQKRANHLYQSQPNGSGGGGGGGVVQMGKEWLKLFIKKENGSITEKSHQCLCCLQRKLSTGRRQLSNTSNKMIGCEDQRTRISTQNMSLGSFTS